MFVNVSYPPPLIIAGRSYKWHLPLTSVLWQTQLLKGQTPQALSITFSLSSLPAFLAIFFCFSMSDSLVALSRGETKILDSVFDVWFIKVKP